MAEISLADARACFPDLVDRARASHQPVYLTQAKKRVAALIDSEDLDRLVEPAEDLADIQAAQVAPADAVANGTIAWPLVKAELRIR